MFEKPNYHNTPNEFVDTHLKELSGAETKILNVIFRKTFGFHKDFDYISIAQFVDYTGLSKQSIIDSTKSLINKDLIQIKYQCPKCNSEYPSIEKDFVCTTCRTHEQPNKLFSISIENKSRQVIQKISKVVKKLDRGSLKIRQGVVQKLDTQKERVQKETNTKEKGGGPGPVQDLSTQKIIHDSDDTPPPPPEFLNKEEKEYANITRKLIEHHYELNYFFNRKIMPKERLMLIEIGKFPEEKIVKAIEKKGLGLKNPLYLISNVFDELNNNGKKDIDPKKIEIQKEIDYLNDIIPNCVNKEEFWGLLKRAVLVSSQPNPIEYLFTAYKPERIKLNATEDYEWFFRYCQIEDG
jgi:hypothetical protein